MGLFVGDQIDNKTERHIARSIRLLAVELGFGAILVGAGVLLWGLSRIF